MRCKAKTVVLLSLFLFCSILLVGLINTVIAPSYSDVLIQVSGSGTTSPAAGEYASTYLLGSTLSVTAYPASGWHYVKMQRNSVDWTTSNPGEFLSLGEYENITVVFQAYVTVVVRIEGSGSSTPSAGTYSSTYSLGDVINVYGVADSGWVFYGVKKNGVYQGYTSPTAVTLTGVLTYIDVHFDVLMSWHPVETWSLSVAAAASGWHNVETWSLNVVGVGGWRFVESWNFHVASSSTGFHDVETWSFNVSSVGGMAWRDVEYWNFSVQALAWRNVESWNFSVNATSSFRDVEWWNFTINSTAISWYDVECWNFTLNVNASWHTVECWNFTLSTVFHAWRDVETWSFDGFGFYSGFAWPAHVPFYLSTFGTYIDFNDTAYFDSFSWSPGFTSISFWNIKMDAGSPVPMLTVSILNGNITFTSIDYLHQIGFDIYAVSGTQPILYLSGIGQIPSLVTVEGTTEVEGSKWNYVSDTLTVTYPFTYTGGSSVMLYWGVAPTSWKTVEVWTVLPFTGTLPSVEVYSQYYFKADSHTINGVTGYNLQLTSGFSHAYVQQNLGLSNDSVQFGFKAYMINSTGAAVSAITGADQVALLTRSVTGEGYQVGIVSVPDVAMNLGYESIKIEMYIRLSTRAWLLSVTFTSDRLMYKGLIAGNWAFDVYTKTEVDPSGNTLATAYWGSQPFKSSVMGLHFIEPLPQEVALWKMANGDWLGGMFYPYMLIVGDAFYGLGLLFVGGVLYLRHKKWEVILIALLLFGGPAGLGFLIPDIAYRLVYLVVAFVIAVVLYRVFR